MNRVLVTGAEGFIGKNLRLALNREAGTEIIGVDLGTAAAVLERGLDEAEAVIHLAGVNRPEKENEFEDGNVGSLAAVLAGLERRGRRPLVVLSSSIQALLDNPYGRSKKRAEDALLDFHRRTGAAVRIFRLPGVFGKWCRPNYNSVVATFCHNIARDLPISISDPDREIDLVHVDDVVAAFLAALKAGPGPGGASFLSVTPVFRVSLGALAGKIQAFRAVRETLAQPALGDPFDRRLFGTYVSYLPEEEFDYDLAVREDERGALAELLKLGGHGQIFVSRTRPGVTRGNHYHDSKVEKFVVLEGEAVIRFRRLTTGEIIEYPVCGREMRVVDIPPGWTHSIENVGTAEMIVLFWASEIFDPARPDTFAAKVRNEKA
ncbi:MAG TPA: NAD-dependent epimerase/dehydratase family protein [Candidatus Aminicenantes bacterium]|nr:MAG: NAD dependent epimerase/dehydratase family protein [Candidatus Aminicenantes bacterium ADurb.Bin147]HNQ81382.1 NAD-dependent epimerase/dehydratase family protein [Candidatus Aminicenantes bacterium]HOY98509.1 NAD-dependent epimerase/dehydratase family protein [Candidatus Aminicenantes bacterium]HPH45277.1 NAD-dependent epimerase/dehydratase family protein [Candidatus Aminicenantes bacterium]